MTSSTYFTLCAAIHSRRRRLIELWLEAYGLGMTENQMFWAEDLAQLNDAELELTTKENK